MSLQNYLCEELGILHKLGHHSHLRNPIHQHYPPPSILGGLDGNFAGGKNWALYLLQSPTAFYGQLLAFPDFRAVGLGQGDLFSHPRDGAGAGILVCRSVCGSPIGTRHGKHCIVGSCTQNTQAGTCNMVRSIAVQNIM